MTKTGMLLILALLFIGLLLLALLVWAFGVRPYVKKSGARPSSPFTLVALVADFSTGLLYSRGRLPRSLRFFGLILALLVTDVVLAVLLVLFGT